MGRTVLAASMRRPSLFDRVPAGTLPHRSRARMNGFRRRTLRLPCQCRAPCLQAGAVRRARCRRGAGHRAGRDAELAENYGDRPAAELPLLFTRILQNTIHDYFRRQKVRSTWVTLFSALGGGRDDEEDADPLETLEALAGSDGAESAADKVERSQVIAIIEEEISRLPARQREAFLMRYWEEMDVAETAAAMGAPRERQTHCSRATHALAKALSARGITL